MRKGQITMFVIIGLVLAVLVILSFAFKESIVEQAGRLEITKGLTMTTEARKVQSDMESCLTEVAEFGLATMGLQGGYTSLSSRIHSTDTKANMNYFPYFGTAYLYFKGQSLVPTEEMMEKQLSEFITANMIECEAEYPGIDVEYGRMTTFVDIQEEKINLNVNSDIKIKKEEKESGFKTIRTEVPVRLGTIQNVLNEIVDQQIKTSEEELCISCISRIAAENDIDMTVDKVGEDIFYSLTDEKSKVIGNSFIFLFANKF